MPHTDSCFSKALGIETEDDIHFLASHFFKADDEGADESPVDKVDDDDDEEEDRPQQARIESMVNFFILLFKIIFPEGAIRQE